ncbi:alpha/beta hydrolase [Desertivirga arenae]|uniref:alpha/beta hydrolase n=1 Tax=Desertivirga arenae TaxID=2810309 RepID=UPI001A95CE04|nr:alpha/beta hydrolase [Pedobacter sp. SYSU D00823]
MRNSFLTLLFLMLCFVAFSQKTEYTQINNIHYYSDSLNQSDKYINERCALDIYYPKNQKNFKTVVWFHGGGLTGGRKEIPASLREKGICVVGVGYRLAPNVKSPEYIKDAAAAVAWTFKNIQKYGGDPSLIFLSGHSAGAYLVDMVTLDKTWLGPHGIDANKIAGLISLSAQAITHFTIRKERGLADTKVVVDNFAPLNLVRADAPPTLLVTGDRELEMLGRYEENAYLYRMFKLVGHKDVRLLELQGYDHGGMAEPAFPLLLKEMDRIAKLKK